MFIGHYGLALAAKRAAPATSLATLTLSTQFLDLIWPVFLLLGLEHVRIAPGITRVSPFDFYDYPISHSLAAVIGWAALVGFIYFRARRYRRGAWVLAAGVLSHWVLDALVHRSDLPLAPGVDIYVGLGLWNSLAATLVAEFGIFFGGLLIYLQTTKPIDRVGFYGFWAFVVFLLVAFLSATFSKPPDNVSQLAWMGLALWLTPLWAGWADKHRVVRDSSSVEESA